MNASKEERALLSLLPVVVMWIKEDTDLTDQEIQTVGRLHPKEFEFARTTSTAEMLKFMEKYRSNKHYRDLIDVVLSDTGWKWVERTVEKVKKISLEADGKGPNPR